MQPMSFLYSIFNDKIYLAHLIGMITLLSNIDIIIKIILGIIITIYTAAKVYKLMGSFITDWKLKVIEEEKLKLRLQELEQQLKELKGDD